MLGGGIFVVSFQPTKIPAGNPDVNQASSEKKAFDKIALPVFFALMDR
jgi:hypothetical protein